MKKNIVIIHYNTPRLTEALIKSINKNVKDAIVYIFDNSDKEPFTAKFNNVKLIDNTKGDIINFDDWLKKYPDREKTSAKKNNFASAKHAYSIQKCMDIINENFILLDSDILLKKDISDMFSDENVFVGSTEFWKARIGVAKHVKERAIPYICFINVNKCKEYDIKYFDDKRIYGLTSNGDNYDTGASFLEDIKKKKIAWKKISIIPLIVHYKAGSWVEAAKIYDKYRQINSDRWLEINKKYWSDEKNKKVIYTCITGGYDNIIEPAKITEDFDYICFTDDKTLTSNFWEIRELPEEVKDLSVTKKQRYVKINAHKVLPEYELSIWVDGNVLVKGDLNKLIEKYVKGKENISVFVPKHPKRDCIYAEANACISMKKDTAENIKPQIEKYRKEGFPEKYGLLQSNILIRKHLKEDCIRLMEDWFNVLKDGSHRDQLSFNYVCWKNQDVKVFYLPETICYSDWFRWKAIHTKNSKIDINSIKEKIKSKHNVERISLIKRYKEKTQIRYL